MMVPYKEQKRLQQRTAQHRSDRTQQKGSWGHGPMDDAIELFFSNVRDNWKTKPILNNLLKV